MFVFFNPLHFDRSRTSKKFLAEDIHRFKTCILSSNITECKVSLLMPKLLICTWQASLSIDHSVIALGCHKCIEIQRTSITHPKNFLSLLCCIVRRPRPQWVRKINFFLVDAIVVCPLIEKAVITYAWAMYLASFHLLPSSLMNSYRHILPWIIMTRSYDLLRIRNLGLITGNLLV